MFADLVSSFTISIYNTIRAKTHPANENLGCTSYLGLLALSQHGEKSGRDHQNSFPSLSHPKRLTTVITLFPIYIIFLLNLIIRDRLLRFLTP